MGNRFCCLDDATPDGEDAFRAQTRPVRNVLQKELSNAELIAACDAAGSSVTAIISNSHAPHIQVPFHAKYALHGLLGQGSFGAVHSATLHSNPTETVAVKIIKREFFSLTSELSTQREINILLAINHPNIVQYLEYFKEPSSFYLVFEFMAGGELFDRIACKESYNESEARNIMKQLLLALGYLHRRNIVHRDLKPENLLLESCEADAVIKIADFGLATVVPETGLTDDCGSLDYIAPEILCHKHYGVEVDLWSLGVIAYIILAGYPPFYHPDQIKCMHKIMTGSYVFHDPYWSHISSPAKEFVTSLLTVDRSKRLGAVEALQHPWMTAGDHQLSSHSLDANLEMFKRFDAARKRWRKAGHAVMAANKFKNNIQSLSAKTHDASSLLRTLTAPTTPAAAGESSQQMTREPFIPQSKPFERRSLSSEKEVTMIEELQPLSAAIPDY